jgi:uncharacterized protein
MSPFIVDHREALAELCRRYRVRSLFLFGSAVRDDFDPQRSDVDLLVDFEPLPDGAYADAYFGLREALEALLDEDAPLCRVTSGPTFTTCRRRPA